MANITLTDDVADILSRSRITGNNLYLPPERLEPKRYQAVNKAIVAAGGKWKGGKISAHVFENDPREKLGLMLETGVAVDEKKKYQAFFTPPDLAAQVAEMADVEGQTVLEPSAGYGSLADACLAAGADRVECVELHPENAAKLRVKEYQTTEGDFLAQSPKPYSRIVMNPPFTKDQDIKHVSHALRFLAPGGVLVAIMADSPNRPKFAAMLKGYRYEIEAVPAGAFKASGTSVRTMIVRVYSANATSSQPAAGGVNNTNNAAPPVG